MTTTPFRPANSAEGGAFIRRWCSRCTRDASLNGTMEFEDAEAEDLICPIYGATIRHELGEAEFPPEWVLLDGVPTCTAFDELVPEGGLTDAEKAAQGPLL